MSSALSVILSKTPMLLPSLLVKSLPAVKVRFFSVPMLPVTFSDFPEVISTSPVASRLPAAVKTFCGSLYTLIFSPPFRTIVPMLFSTLSKVISLAASTVILFTSIILLWSAACAIEPSELMLTSLSVMTLPSVNIPSCTPFMCVSP